MNKNVIENVQHMSLADRINLLDNKNSKITDTRNRNVLNDRDNLHNVSQWHAHQSLPKELPRYGGATDEWAIFYNAFKNSSDLCQLNHLVENLLRLQICLKYPKLSL